MEKLEGTPRNEANLFPSNPLAMRRVDRTGLFLYRSEISFTHFDWSMYSFYLPYNGGF